MLYKKPLIAVFSLVMFSLLTVSGAFAMTAALVVKDKDHLSDVHERMVEIVLRDMGFNITLVDKDVSVDYYDFDILVVAGRPVVSDKEHLDSFVADLPVNEVPTIAIDYKYPDDWGWADTPGISSFVGSQRQRVYITEEHPLTWGYFLDERVYVHMAQGYNILDLVEEYTNLEAVASPTTNDRYGAIRYGLPGTQLNDGKRISSDSAVVFFGITYPNQWTEDAEDLFRNAVNWLTEDTDGDGLLDYMDNCVYIVNPGQEDLDQDRIGDVCDGEDNRPDLTVSSIQLPTERIECEDLELDVIIENIGNGDALNYDLELLVGTAVYDASGVDIEAGQSETIEFTIAGEYLCGSSSKTLTAVLENVQPNEIDPDNNELEVELVFTTVKADVDGDGEMEEARDKNYDAADGYEFYYDPNSNTDEIGIDGDPDGKLDYLIDVGEDGTLDKYWDPDDSELTDLIYQVDNTIGNPTDVVDIDFDGDGDTDATYNTTSGEITYMDDITPQVGSISVTPTYGSSTWYRFDISAYVEDEESGIDKDSCEYTTNGVNWYDADYDNNNCYKNDISANIGGSLTINIRVRDRVGNLATGSSVQRTVSIRPLSVSINPDKSSYSPNEDVHVYGYVSYEDSGEEIDGATVSYSFESITGTIITDSNGYYEFDITTPDSYGQFGVVVDADHTHAEGYNSLVIDVPEPTVPDTPTSGTVPAMTMQVPAELSSEAGKDLEFVATIENVGLTTLYTTKVSVEGDISYDVYPSVVDVPSGESQDFTVTLHIPDDAAGIHVLTVKGLSYKSSVSKGIVLDVSEKKTALIDVIGIDIPELYEDEPAKITITLRNDGDGEAVVTQTLLLPETWTPTMDSSEFTIMPFSEKTVSFTIIPTASGKIDFVTSYDDVTIVNSTDVIVKAGRDSQSITGMIVSVVSNPGFYLPALASVSAAIIFMVYRNMSTGVPVRKTYRSSKGSKTLLTTYNKWESRYKRTRSRR